MLDELISLEQRIAAPDIPLPPTAIALRFHYPHHPGPVPLPNSRPIDGGHPVISFRY